MLVQNRAYAVSQLSDLQQKLAKAAQTVPSSHAPQPVIKEEKTLAKVRSSSSPILLFITLVILQKNEKKQEESQLVKSVKDRYVSGSPFSNEY